MTAPEPIANIINPAWLAAQMGLPVKDVEQQLKKGLRNEHPQDHARL